MDTSDPDIHFNANGVCTYCTNWMERVRNETFAHHPTRNLQSLVTSIKAAGRRREFDCIIGVSGGVDSTYVAYLVKDLGLRPLAVHLDNGWNSELAVDNIHLTLSKLGVELHTHVIDWEEFRDLQLSFIKASVTNIEIPTDHGINAILQQVAVQNQVRYILTGSNIRGEGMYPRSWGWYNLDLRHLEAVHQRFGSIALKTFPRISLTTFAINTLFRGIRTVPILNYIDYNRPKVVKLLVDRLGWRPYPGKHYESIFTRFFQGYILPRKFNVDKRRPHLATLVAAGDISRDDALNQLSKDPYEGSDLESDLEYFLKKFDLTRAQFEVYMREPIRQHREFKTNAWFFDGLPFVKRIAKQIATRK
jgi:N-acetyl sugar amidotransferase